MSECQKVYVLRFGPRDKGKRNSNNTKEAYYSSEYAAIDAAAIYFNYLFNRSLKEIYHCVETFNGKAQDKKFENLSDGMLQEINLILSFIEKLKSFPLKDIETINFLIDDLLSHGYFRFIFYETFEVTIISHASTTGYFSIEERIVGENLKITEEVEEYSLNFKEYFPRLQ